MTLMDLCYLTMEKTIMLFLMPVLLFHWLKLPKEQQEMIEQLVKADDEKQ